MIDKSAESAEDPNYLLTLADIQAWENEHGPLPPGGWLFLRTGWDARAHDQEAFLNGGRDAGPGRRVRALAGRGLGRSSASASRPSAPTRALAHSFDPPFPVHHFLLGAGKYGLTQLANLAELPPTGRGGRRRAAEARGRDGLAEPRVRAGVSYAIRRSRSRAGSKPCSSSQPAAAPPWRSSSTSKTRSMISARGLRESSL